MCAHVFLQSRQLHTVVCNDKLCGNKSSILFIFSFLILNTAKKTNLCSFLNTILMFYMYFRIC